jgi:hypothetical protein
MALARPKIFFNYFQLPIDKAMFRDYNAVGEGKLFEIDFRDRQAPQGETPCQHLLTLDGGNDAAIEKDHISSLVWWLAP